MAGIVRRGLTYYARVIIPEARQRDVGRAFGAANGIRRDIVRTLETTNRREAEQRRAEAAAAINDEVNARLRRIGAPPLSDWRASWADEAKRLRDDLAAAPPDHGAYRGQDYDSVTSLHEVVLDRIRDKARELEDDQGERTAASFFAIATGAEQSIQHAADEWLAEVERRGDRRQQTIGGHRAALRQLETFCQQQDLAPALDALPLSAFGRAQAGAFVRWRAACRSDKSGQPLAAATVRRELSSLQGLWRWALRNGHAKLNPWNEQSGALPTRQRTSGAIEAEARTDGGKRPYTTDELCRLLRATGDEWAPNGGRYATVLWDAVRLLLLTGCRANELASAAVGDIEGQGTLLRVRRGKTINAPRVILLPRRRDAQVEGGAQRHGHGVCPLLTSSARPEQLIEEIAEPSLEHVHLGFRDRNMLGPVVGDGPDRKVVLRRPAGKWPRVAKQRCKLLGYGRRAFFARSDHRSRIAERGH